MLIGCYFYRKKALRIMNKAPLKEHCKPLFIKSKILTVINLYIYVCLLYVKKEFDLGLVVHRSDFHSYNTRNQLQLDVPYSRLSKCKNSFNIISLKIFNKLHNESQLLEFNKFKLRCYNWFSLNPFYDLNEFFSLRSVHF